MPATEIKALIHRQVDQITDEEQLALLEAVLLNITAPAPDTLPDHVQRGIEAGLADADAGRFASPQQAAARAQKWLSK